MKKLESIGQELLESNKDTKAYLKAKNLESWKEREVLRQQKINSTSECFQMIDDFKGRFLRHIYEHNVECMEAFEEVQVQAAQEFNNDLEPALKPYALAKMRNI